MLQAACVSECFRGSYTPTVAADIASYTPLTRSSHAYTPLTQAQIAAVAADIATGVTGLRPPPLTPHPCLNHPFFYFFIDHKAQLKGRRVTNRWTIEGGKKSHC
jgi:hypothetical protein